ncbi:MAG: glycosyltransferase family 4 protein [Anaerolineales bacterium]
MKILLLNSEYPPIGGGAGNASANIARLLVHMGNDVLLLTSLFEGLPQDEIRDGVRIVRVPALRRRIDRSSAVEQISFIFSASFRTFSLARQFKPDVTLAFFGLPSGAVAWLLRKRLGIPYVVSLRGGDVPGFRPYDFRIYHKLATPLLHLIWHGASAVVANSRGLHDLASEFDSTIDIPIIPNGVDLDKFSMPVRNWSPPRILSVGRVVYQKGFDLAMRGLAGLKDLEWEWSIAGDGPQMTTLHAMADEFGLRERVHFLGWQNADQIKDQYAAANVFLFPSRHEGMPNVVLEAMASGLPVVATRIAGSEELVSDGETGALVPAENVESLRESLKPLLVKAKLRERMGRAARLRVERSFNWMRVAEGYQLILEKAMK